MRMDPYEKHADLLDMLPDLVEEIGKRFPYVAFSLADERTVQVWTTGRRSGVGSPMPDTGIVLRIWDGAGFAEFGSNRLSAVEVRRWARAHARGAVIRGRENPPPAREKIVRDFAAERNLDAPGVEKVSFDLAAIHSRLSGMDKCIVSAKVSCELIRVFKAFFDSDRSLTQDLGFCGASFAAYASDGRRSSYATGGNKICGGYDRLDSLASDQSLAKTVKYAKDMLGAGKVHPGLQAIVTSPEVSATVAHEAFGHGVELDMFAKGCARAGEFIGKQVASPLVDMYDSPGVPESAGFSFFDDEGELSRPTRIIEAGTLKSCLSDAWSAWRLRAVRTPNGRRESFRRKVYSRMTNTYFGHGGDSPDAIMKKADSGVLLCGGGVGMEDPLGWGMQIDVRLGYEFRNGTLTGRVFAPVGLTGFVPDLLKSISAVGLDLEMRGAGKCGKTFRKDWIPVGMGGPTLLMEGRLA